MSASPLFVTVNVLVALHPGMMFDDVITLLPSVYTRLRFAPVPSIDGAVSPFLMNALKKAYDKPTTAKISKTTAPIIAIMFGFYLGFHYYHLLLILLNFSNITRVIIDFDVYFGVCFIYCI